MIHVFFPLSVMAIMLSGRPYRGSIQEDHHVYDEETFEFYIYDRWGDLIYKSTGTFNNYIGWDGVANRGNKQAQEDVYVWLIRTDDLNGDTHEVIGHVTLIK